MCATESIILHRLSLAKDAQGVGISHTQKFFYLRLLNLALKSGVETDSGLSIVLPVITLSDALKVPLRTTIQCLKRLNDCGVILRIDAPSFPRSASTTLLKIDYYVKEYDHEKND